MGLKDPSESMYGVAEEEAKRLLTLGRFDELMDRVGGGLKEAALRGQFVVLLHALMRSSSFTCLQSNMPHTQ